MDVYAVVDGSQYPIIHISIKKLEPTKELMNQMFDEIEAICDSHEGPFIVIGENSNGSTWMSVEVRKEMAQRFQHFIEKNRERFLVSIFVLPNIVTRMILKGVNLFIKVHNTQFIVNNMEEARKKASEILKENIDSEL